MSEPESRKIITVDGVAALAEPVFVIEKNGVYYLTLAVWEYDPAKIFDPSTNVAVHKVVDFHTSELSKGNVLRAALTERGALEACCATDPFSPPEPPPPGDEGE